MAEFVMPSLGADMTAGTLIMWLKKPGDKVERGDIIAEVDTDKGVIEVEVFQSGVIGKLLVREGEKVPVGTVLATIDEGEKAAGKIEPEKPKAEVQPTGKDEPTASAPIEKRAESVRLHASPVAKKLAEELGVDLSKIAGTGPSGRIQREDVELAAKEKSPENAVAETLSVAEPDRYARMRRAIAAAMAKSKREIPHYYLAAPIDLSRALDWLEIENSRKALKERILPNVLLLKAVALALRETPELNATWENERLILKEKINVGAAIALRQGGLVAPALFETDKQTLDELMKNLRDLVARARAGTLRSSELSDSTITVTDLGERGAETVFGVIYPPQVALVGFGAIYDGVSVSGGAIRASRLINATLAADHRASDGHRGGVFLSKIRQLLQEPEKL